MTFETQIGAVLFHASIGRILKFSFTQCCFPSILIPFGEWEGGCLSCAKDCDVPRPPFFCPQPGSFLIVYSTTTPMSSYQAQKGCAECQADHPAAAGRASAPSDHFHPVAASRFGLPLGRPERTLETASLGVLPLVKQGVLFLLVVHAGEADVLLFHRGGCGRRRGRHRRSGVVVT